MPHFVGTFLVVVLFALAVKSQTCEPWSGQPAYCKQFLAWQEEDVTVYVPVNQTLAYLESRVSSAINYVGSLGDDGSIASQCNQFWAQLNCATYLRPCLVDPVTSNFVPLPKQPCKTSCQDYETMCAEYVAEQELPLGVGLYLPPGYTAPMTCQELDTDGQDFFQSFAYTASPFDTTAPTNETQIYPMQCNSLLSNGTSFVVCEDPLSTVKRNECGFTCPLPSYTDEQYNTIKVLQLVLAWLSWTGSLIVVLTYVLHNKLRKFPSNLILMAAVAAHAESVGMILPTFFGYDNTWCGFDTEYLMPETRIADATFVVDFHIEDLSVVSGLCTFQGWLVQMGFLSSTMWWGIVAFNMFLSVFFGKKLPNTKAWNNGLQIVLHVCGWAVPSFLMLIPAAAGKISFSPGGTFCSLDSADVYFLVFWGLPVGIILLVGTLLFGASLVRLLQFASQMKEIKKACGTYFRVILFILIYLCLITFIFAYSLRVVTAKDTIEDGYSEYYKCLIQTKDNCTLSEEVHNYGLAVLRSLGYSSLGLMLFLNFCISPSMGRFWWRFFNNVRQGKFSSMFTSEKTPTGKSPGGKSNSKKSRSTATHDMITMSVDDGDDEIIP